MFHGAADTALLLRSLQTHRARATSLEPAEPGDSSAQPVPAWPGPALPTHPRQGKIEGASEGVG